MYRLHIIGGKNHGKTTLVVELVKEFTTRAIPVGTIKHTHHEHELDIPGKDSHRHRVAGALAVGILSPSMTAMYLPVTKELVGSTDRYAIFSHVFSNCRLILVEGDSQTQAAKIEVWRKDLGTPPLAWQDQGILAVVTDDPISVDADVLPRANVSAVVDWIARNLLAP